MTAGHRPVALELIAQDTAAVRVAAAVGAARVELCQALALGGLTPSIATIESAAGAVDGVEVHVLIRPRAGGFRYSDDEVAVMAGDVRAAIGAGAAGVVIGCLDAAGSFDHDAMRRLRDAAQDVRTDAEVSAHRAIDVCADPFAALDALVDLGIGRVLTSGGAPTALAGADTLRRLVGRAGGAIDVMAGGGVTAEAVSPLLATGVRDLHFSAKRTVSEPSALAMGSADGVYEVADLAAARAIADAVLRG